MGVYVYVIWFSMGLNGDIRLRVSLYDIDFIYVNKIVVVLLFEWFM